MVKEAPSLGSQDAAIANRLAEAKQFWDNQPTQLPPAESYFADLGTMLDPSDLDDVGLLDRHALDRMPTHFPFPIAIVKVVGGQKVYLPHPKAEAAMDAYMRRNMRS